jgi:hypothetical protein
MAFNNLQGFQPNKCPLSRHSHNANDYEWLSHREQEAQADVAIDSNDPIPQHWAP